MSTVVGHEAKNIFFLPFLHKKSASKFEYLSTRSDFIDFTPEMPCFSCSRSLQFVNSRFSKKEVNVRAYGDRVNNSAIS